MNRNVTRRITTALAGTITAAGIFAGSLVLGATEAGAQPAADTQCSVAFTLRPSGASPPRVAGFSVFPIDFASGAVGPIDEQRQLNVLPAAISFVS